MILRRFTQHIKEQNWFAVGLDVLVVIVGIFLGLQVTNWQEQINEDDDANEYLNRLHDNLQVDLKNIKHREIFWTQVVNYSATALEYLESPDLRPKAPWPYLLAVFQSSQIAPLEITDITYRELQQAGQLALIRNKQLRQDLAEYYSFNNGAAAETLLKVNPPYRNYIRGKVPTDISDYIWENCFNVANISDQRLIACDAPISDERANKVLIELRQERAILSMLRSWYITNRAALHLLAKEKEINASLINTIEKQLKK